MNINGYEYISQSEYWDFVLNQTDSHQLLALNVNEGVRAALFNKYVASVNLELTSYCNRSCGYCPVSSLVEKPKEFINESLFQNVLSSFSGIAYRGIFTLNLFNEPLAHPDYLIEKIRAIKSACPDSYVRINTNGDYLSAELLAELISAGISEILLTIHVLNGKQYNDEKQLVKLKKKLEKLNLSDSASLVNHELDKNITFEANLSKTRILIVSNKWDQFGVDRGGTVTHLSIAGRNSPCLIPFRELTIDYRGQVLWCWNVFRDDEFSFGRLDQSNPIEIYFGERAVNLRRHLFLFAQKERICSTCNVSSFTNVGTTEARKLVFERTCSAAAT